MLSVKNVSFQYDANNSFDFPDMECKAGDQWLVLGKSGSGKTTMLNILGGLLSPLQGEVLIDKTSIYQLNGAHLDKFRGKNIGIVFQKPHILGPLTVEENISLANFFVGKKSSAQISQVLVDLGIEEKRKARVSTLSEGEAQRVSIARALANEPKLILADEPTASLDDLNAGKVVQLLKDQAEKHRAVLIIVTHDQRVKAHFRNQITMGETR